MKLENIINTIDNFFETKNNPKYYEECGVTADFCKEIHKIGYSTNLTLEVVEKAKENNVDLIITHHDAWDFVYGLKDACMKKLEQYNISHYFNHLPLDDCEFGTNDTILKLLNLNLIEKNNLEDGFYCGRIAEFNSEEKFEDVVQSLEKLLNEPVQKWKFNNKPIKKVGLVSGAGVFTTDLKYAVEKNCDLYITGEKMLYLIQYAQFKNINLIITSHTFIELFGVESLTRKVKEVHPEIIIIRIEESHLETNP